MTIGAELADARHRAGLTVTQVGQQTRIREAIIRDIEQDDFASCGGDFYARGHIRSIAGAIGVDPVPLISEFDEAHGPVSPLRAAEVFEPAKPIKIRERRSPSLAMIVVVVLLAIIGFGAYRLVDGSGSSGPPAAAGSSAPPSVQSSAVAKASPTVVPSSSPSSSDLVIKVAAGQESCWVQLTKVSDGSQIFMGVVSANSSKTWTESQRVAIRLGNPGGITLTVNGQRQTIKTVLPTTLKFSPPGGSSAGTSASSPASGSA
jgi:cytoskeletal protein RodZ